MKKAFSLIEILMVMAIIGILAALGIVALSNLRSNAVSSTLQARVRQLNIAKEQFITENGRLEAEASWNSAADSNSRYGFLKRYIERPQNSISDIAPQGCTLQTPTNIHGLYTGVHTLDNGAKFNANGIDQ